MKSLLTPLAFLERTASAFPERIGVADGERRLTWAELRERVRRLALALQQAGIERGDRVAFLSPNTTELLEAHFGVPRAGGVLVAINTRLMPEEIAAILAHSGSRLLVAHESLAYLVEDAPVDRVIVCGESGDYEDFLAAAGTGEPEQRLESEDDTISINYTSGTTGHPKGVMYTHRGAYLTALAEMVHARVDSRSVYLWTLPMFHCNGWCFTWAVTAAGARHVCLPRVDPALVWRLIAEEGVTHLNGAPTVLVMLTSDPAAAPLERPVLVTTGGARLRDQPRLRPHGDVRPDRDLRVEPGLGRPGCGRARPSEGASGHQPRDGRSGARRRSRAAGRSSRWRDDGRGRDAGRKVMKGYFADEAATAEAFRGGWFHSGDLGVMHPDGYIELRDRAKDMIISGGENISTIEVERALVANPDVLEAAVVAVPDEKWSERPKAFVTLEQGAELTEDELIAFSRETLPGFKAPSEIEFGDLPRTSTGKVKKNELQARARARAPSP